MKEEIIVPMEPVKEVVGNHVMVTVTNHVHKVALGVRIIVPALVRQDVI